jgi:hypothetical protein
MSESTDERTMTLTSESRTITLTNQVMFGTEDTYGWDENSYGYSTTAYSFIFRELQEGDISFG